jgi:hypothetical protein
MVLPCPEASNTFSGQDNESGARNILPARAIWQVSKVESTCELEAWIIQRRASNTIYIPEENSMALVFPET